MKQSLRDLWQTIALPFVIFRIRMIQEHYRYLTNKYYDKPNKMAIARLKLLLAKEYYWKTLFERGGIYYQFDGQALTPDIYLAQIDYMDFLFPAKLHEQIPEVTGEVRPKNIIIQESILN